MGEAGHPDFWTYLWLCLSAVAAGVINSLAGGGTLLTFPSLFSVVDKVTANGTSTAALLPGSLAGGWGYRRQLAGIDRWAALLVVPSLVGGAIGTLLVTLFPDRYFEALVPWLILAAAVLFLVQPLLIRWAGVGKPHEAPARGTRGALIAFQFLVAVYGGYFGAGIGILMITSLSLMGLGDIRRVNALKTILAACINGVSVVVWVAMGRVVWRYALPMAAAAILGGYLGARLGTWIPRVLVRWLVIVLGFGLAGYYFLRP